MAQYHVNLSFSADASKAKAQLKDLQNQLTNLINTPQSKLGIEGEINSAIKAAAELKAHLQAATNVKTGNLDFSKLSQSLKQSNTSLTQYATKLQQLGPAGQQAFMTLAQSVAQAEIPIHRSSAALDKMWATLKNTARWQVSSTVLHGFMGAVQSAYGYAQDLNQSLNDIRIVTGQNTDEMAKFAKEANTAAKALSTSTTNYTKASLIYYQQGLSDQQVKERTDITIKMANVTRSSAEDVSDQMTAVWNNFYDGSKSLESYADALAALGASTASSSDEISEGLQKFAAVANTVGLSYEYAASALATLTANTRESADVVGTALKTLFARIQSLKLGETLEDGTTLTKYSQDLQKVGVSVYDANGELKAMDTLLNELGAKWEQLNSSQKSALAQSVAGVRQYNQFMALMENWDNGDSDSMKANLQTIKASEGALSAQADTYADSWEAARNRVTAAAEEIYDKLLDDEFFIDVLNNIEKILSFVDGLIDKLGGLEGVLYALGAVVTKVFSNQIAQGITNLTYNLTMMTSWGQKKAEEQRIQFLNDAKNSIQANPDFITQSEQAMQSSITSSIELQQTYLENVSKMSAKEQELNKILIDRTSLLKEQAIEASRRKESADNEVSDSKVKVRARIEANPDDAKAAQSVKQLNNEINNLRSGQKAILEVRERFNAMSQGVDAGTISVQDLQKSIGSILTRYWYWWSFALFF